MEEELRMSFPVSVWWRRKVTRCVGVLRNQRNDDPKMMTRNMRRDGDEMRMNSQEPE